MIVLAIFVTLGIGCNDINTGLSDSSLKSANMNHAELSSNGFINRVVNPFWDKKYFNGEYLTSSLSKEEWYFRRTVVGTPPNTSALSVGDGHWLHPETIRWEITEKFLIGWRAYGSTLGAEGELSQLDGYKGMPVVVFPITQHFDIAQNYDAMTLEGTNEIAENETDQVWEKRRFFRVDLSQNVVHKLNRQDPWAGVLGAETLDTDTAYVVANNNPSDPNRYRFEKDYFEATTRQGVTADALSYYGYMGPAFGGDSAAPVIDTRLSFLKKQNSDYVPLNYPDTVTLVDNAGESIRDNNGKLQRIPIWERFGFYRSNFSGRPQWTTEYGPSESTKNFNITRFNIWEKSLSETGLVIPIPDREPKAIHYYTNVHHPKSLMNASRKVESEWDSVFREVVFHAQPGKYESAEAVPPMWILHENSCNLKNVKEYLKSRDSSLSESVLGSANLSLEGISSRIDHANDMLSDLSFTKRHYLESAALSDLEKVCSALEHFTSGKEDAFTYQRPGDLRYNMLNLLPGRAPTSWSGLGPMLADAITGEIIQSVANVNLWYIDSRAAKASQQIDAINGEVTFKDLVFGRDISSYIAKKNSESAAEGDKLPSEEAVEKFVSLNLGAAGNDLEKLAPSPYKSMVNKLKTLPNFEGNLIEQSPEEMIFSSLSKHRTPNSALVGDRLNHILSPLNGMDFLAEFQKAEQKRKQLSLSVKDPPEFVDNLVVGIALQYKDLDPVERYYKIREAVYTAVMLHEVGHNVGLVHNMAGSADPLNYGKRFWDIQKLPEDLDAAMAVSDDAKVIATLERCIEEKDRVSSLSEMTEVPVTLTTQTCLRQQEGMYSSIMDYHALWNSDTNGLGLYDKAAVKFGYAQLLEVFPEENLKVNSEDTNLKRWVFLNDWKKIPTDFMQSTTKITERDHVVFNWDNTSSTMVPPNNEVPYLYCSDSSGFYGPKCKAFDFGPDMRGQAQWVKTQYWQHYFFTHFNRDRLWSYATEFNNVISRDLRAFTDFSNIMKWYYFYKVSDEDFTGSDAEKDFLAATVTGLNHFSHVIGQPEPGMYVTTPLYAAGDSTQTTKKNRLEVNNLYRAWEDLSECTAESIVSQDPQGNLIPNEGYSVVKVPLGDGRPYYAGLTDDYEDWYLTYVGSFYSKLYAAYFLAYPGAWYPRTENLKDPGFYAVNWYRLFPNEVGSLFYNLITDKISELGPLVSPAGKFQHRNLLDIETLRAPDYTGYTPIEPKLSNVLTYRYMFYSGLMTSSYMNTALNFPQSMRVYVKGDVDAIEYSDKLLSSDLAQFESPISGQVYVAAKIGDFPVAFELIETLNLMSEQYKRLQACVSDPLKREVDEFCHCVSVREPNPSGSMQCIKPKLQRIGENECSLDDLHRRRDIAEEQMEYMTGFLDEMRRFSSSVLN